MVYGFSSRLNLDAFEQVGTLKISADYSTEKTSQITAEEVNRVISKYIDPNKMIEVRADQFGQMEIAQQVVK